MIGHLRKDELSIKLDIGFESVFHPLTKVL
jgi:hypothetical protein